MRVRWANVADVSAMMVLERASPTAAHWSRQQYERFATTGSSPGSERIAWVVEDEHGGVEQASSKALSVIAFLVARRIDAEWELENILVAGTVCRRGIGTLLLGELVAHARAAGGSGIFLEVRESNHIARALYRKLGFAETGLRKGYYTTPPEDAILCRLSLY
ncbi:MAG: GNAT family N-acetyltransferase [Candidatus Sulfotelmatobacter sp.]